MTIRKFKNWTTFRRWINYVVHVLGDEKIRSNEKIKIGRKLMLMKTAKRKIGYK